MENREYQSVHDAHCCPLHGCKYTHPDCPVEQHREGGIACESCYYDFADDRYWEIAYLMNEVASRVSGERVREACAKEPELEVSDIDAAIISRLDALGEILSPRYGELATKYYKATAALPLAAQPDYGHIGDGREPEADAIAALQEQVK